MSRSYRTRVPIVVTRAKQKKHLKRSTHKSIRQRVREAIKHERFESLYDEWVGKRLPADYWIYDYDVYTRAEELKDFGYTEPEIKKAISK